MDIRSIEYVVTVYEKRNFTKSARALHLTQQGVSKAIAQLEREFGMPLFIREKSHLVPTEFGEIFYQQAKVLLGEYEKTMETLKQAARQKRELQIGFASNVVSALNAESLIVEFQKLYPDTPVDVHHMTDYECESALLDHKLDAAFSMGPFASGIRSELLISEGIFALMSKKHPLADRGFLSVQDLEQEPLIIADAQNKGYSVIHRAFENCHKQLHIAFESSDPLVHLRMASKQMGISLVPGHLKRVFKDVSDVCFLPVIGIPVRNISLIFCEETAQSEQVLNFIRFVTRSGIYRKNSLSDSIFALKTGNFPVD